MREQLLPGFKDHDILSQCVQLMAGASASERAAIFTRPEVVNFILDLVGYTPDRPLYNYRLLEPSFGGGDFLLPSIERLISSLRRAKIKPTFSRLRNCIKAIELHEQSYICTKEKIIDVVNKAGVGKELEGSYLKVQQPYRKSRCTAS